MLKFKLTLTVVGLLLVTASLWAQNVVISDQSGANPDVNAILDVQSANKGVLFPRMSTTGRIALGNANPQNGLLVFDSNTNTYWYWVNSGWVELATPKKEIVIIEERTSASLGDDGGAAPNNFMRRKINTIEPSNSANVSIDNVNYTFTLQSGIYLIQASAPAFAVNRHQLLLRDDLIGGAELVGTNEFSYQSAGVQDFVEQTRSSIYGFVTVPQNSSRIYYLETWVQTTSSNNAALGWAHSGLGPGTENIYARIIIEKID